MSEYESVAVTEHTLPDGRKFITDHDCVEFPSVAGFVARFPNYWTRHEGNLDGWVSPFPEKDHENAL